MVVTTDTLARCASGKDKETLYQEVKVLLAKCLQEPFASLPLETRSAVIQLVMDSNMNGYDVGMIDGQQCVATALGFYEKESD